MKEEKGGKRKGAAAFNNTKHRLILFSGCTMLYIEGGNTIAIGVKF